tara:strand:- start:517 stop:879 length:363 start_codon:yes stop_codon:yes gene_type:complete
MIMCHSIGCGNNASLTIEEKHYCSTCAKYFYEVQNMKYDKTAKGIPPFTDCYITVELNGGSRYQMNIDLTEQEKIWLLDTDHNESWNKLCKSVKNREGIEIIGNYNLISYTIHGNTRPLH